MPEKALLITFTLIVLVTSVAQAGAVRADRSINEPYMDPDYQQWVEIFERPGREVFDHRHAILQALDLKPGMKVADIGAGTGLFTRLFAPLVAPRGGVVAVDISAVFVENILRSAREQGHSNITGVVNTQESVRLPAESIDLAYICDTYHHFESPLTIMRSIHHALRPGGEVIIVDFRRVEGTSHPWVMQHVRSNRDTVISELEAVGFKFIAESKILRTNYFLRFEKQ